MVDATDRLDQFLNESGGLGGKLAILLLQLPPRIVFDGEVITGFLEALSARSEARIVCEPRHASWFSPEGAPCSLNATSCGWLRILQRCWPSCRVAGAASPI
jgi:uncharacterized protein YecE (DUF72 family)